MFYNVIKAYSFHIKKNKFLLNVNLRDMAGKSDISFTLIANMLPVYVCHVANYGPTPLTVIDSSIGFGIRVNALC